MKQHGAHDHAHGQDHERVHDKAGAHTHAAPTGDERRLLLALTLTGGFMVAEVIGGLVSGSLALIADAGHMATDTAALALAWFSTRLARRPATVLRSYGYHRAQVLAAFINGSALIGVSLWIVIEALQRIFAPVEVRGEMMLVVAALGLAVNIAAFAVLHGGGSENLNVRGALLHIVADLLGSAAAILGAIVIIFTGWMPIDPLLSILVALLIVRSAWSLVTRAWHVLMEGAPEGFDVDALVRELKEAAPGVIDVHHVHVWALTPERPLVTLHARIEEDASHEHVLFKLSKTLRERFGLEHATIQIERGACPAPGANDKGQASDEAGGSGA